MTTVSNPTAGPPARLPSLPKRDMAAVDLALRVIGGVLATVGAALTGLLELLFSAVRVHGVLVGVSVVLALAANIVLGWFALRVVGRTWAVAPPAVAWFGLMLVAAQPTREGDILLFANWVSFVMILAGSLGFAGVVFRAMTSRSGGMTR